MRSGRLRYTVDLQRPEYTQDAITGEMTAAWVTVKTVSASIEDVSVREFLESQANQSEVSTRIMIRYVAGITPDMRIKHGETIYNIAGILADKKTGQQFLTIPCSNGVNDG